MLDEKQTQEEINWDEVNNPPEKTYDLFGKIEIKFWIGAFEKGTRGSVPYDPARHDKSHVAIDIYIQPLAEIDVKYPRSLEFHDTAWSKPWTKIIIPSLKALSINDAREINDRWARVGKAPDGNSYQRKDKTTGNLMNKPDGSPDIVETTCFKFVQFFASEDECRAAYLAAGGSPANDNGHNIPEAVVNTEDTERATAYQFLKVIVGNAVRDVDNWQTATQAVAKALVQYPTVSKFFNADSTETANLITEVNPGYFRSR